MIIVSSVLLVDQVPIERGLPPHRDGTEGPPEETQRSGDGHYDTLKAAFTVCIINV